MNQEFLLFRTNWKTWSWEVSWDHKVDKFAHLFKLGTKTKGYSHPHSTPQRIPMGNHRLEHHWFWVNIVPPIMSEVIVVETLKQHAKVRVI
jgi:hypothetical protein